MSYWWIGTAAVAAVGAGMSMDKSNQGKDKGNREVSGFQETAGSIGNDAWSFYSDQLKKLENTDQVAEPSNQLALKNARTQSGASDAAYERAADFYGQYDKSFAPITEKVATDALGYDTQARRDTAAAQAQADVGTAGDAGRATLAREIQSRGGDVNSGNFQATLGKMSVAESAQKAAAGNLARRQVEETGAARLANAANLGQTINNQGAAQVQLGQVSGNSAVTNAQVPLTNEMKQIEAENSAYNQGANIRLGANQQAVSAQGQKKEEGSILGGALTAGGGILGGILSDKNEKTKRRPASDKKAMDAVRKTPVALWQYRKDSVAADGGKEHIGPMAQDVRRTMGEKAAPGGKVIDPINMNGITLAAAKNLDRRLAKVERKLAKA